jgi:ferredoxin
MSYLPVIEESACAGHGDCAAVAPEVFEVEDIARVVGEGPDELILEAAKSCPSLAIAVVDSESGEQIYP